MKQKVTPFLSVLLALSFLMPAALFAKPIEARAAQFKVRPTYVRVSDDSGYNSKTSTWTFGGDGNSNNPIPVTDITWGRQQNCAMVSTIAFCGTTSKKVDAGDTINVSAQISLYDYDNAGYNMYFCILNSAGKELISPRLMDKSGTRNFKLSVKMSNDIEGYFGFISGKLTCDSASESSHVFTARIVSWNVECEPGEVGFWNAVKAVSYTHLTLPTT